MSNEHFTREPVQTYEQVLWRLIGVWDDCYEVTEPGRKLPAEALLVCDLFWVTEAQLRADIRRMWRTTFDRRTRFKPLHQRRKVA